MNNITTRFILLLFSVFSILKSDNINKAVEFYMQGEISLMSKDSVAAENYFNQALLFSPNDASILLSLLELNIANKNFDNIEFFLDKYLNQEKLNINTALLIIDLYKLDNNSKALIIMDSLIKNNPLSLELKYEKAQILILNEYWEELLQLYSDIYILNQEQDVLDTILNIGLTIENPNVLYDVLKYVWNGTKNNIEILELLIQLSYISDDKDVTEKYLHELLGFQPKNEFAVMMLAEIKILNKNFNEAIKLLNSIKEDKNNSLDLYQMLLISYSNIGDYANEMLLSLEIINNFPYESLGYESLAISYLENGEYINAIDILNKAIEKFPEEYYFYYYLGLCYRNVEKNSDAIIYFLKALKINPQLKNVMHELAKLYNLESDYNSSDSLFTILLRDNINDAMIMNDYAYIIANRKNITSEKLDFALKLSEDAIHIVPDSPEYLDTIGWIYYKFGKYEVALKYLLKSKSLDQNNLIILEHLGDVYYKLEEYNKALNIYNKIIIDSPDNLEIAKKIKLLNEK